MRNEGDKIVLVQKGYWWKIFEQIIIGFLDKNTHNCNINTRNTYEDHLCKLPELTYNQAQIQIFESTTQNFTKFLEQTLNKPP